MQPRLLLTSLRENPALAKARRLAASHLPSTVRIVAAGDEADIVLHLDSGYVGLTDLPGLLRQIRAYPTARHFLFSESDWPYAPLPGAYPSLTKALPWARSWSYLPDPDDPMQAAAALEMEPTYLFSFLGRTRTHPVRQSLLALDGPATPCLDLASAPGRLPGFDYRTTYRALIARSHFVLCPRGFGAASIRLFEAMALGRAPVIIADAWLAPPGINWRDFSLVVAEKDILHIPRILQERSQEAAIMGQRARQAFEASFAPAVFFDRLLAMLDALPQATGAGALAAYACRALGWREIRSLAHQLRMQFRSAAGQAH